MPDSAKWELEKGPYTFKDQGRGAREASEIGEGSCRFEDQKRGPARLSFATRRAFETARLALQAKRPLEATDVLVAAFDDLLLDKEFAEARMALRAMKPDEWEPQVLTAILAITRGAPLGDARTVFGNRVLASLRRTFQWPLGRLNALKARLLA